jgi:hypothetical protein
MNKEIPITLIKLAEAATPEPVKTSSKSSSTKSSSSKTTSEKKPKVPHDEMGLIPLEFK